ncbi:DUF1775 domain-containing protein [Kribbella alba]|uniref:DUF1775 domain-containing protein n=1 Tax=Kribbella alba TaxID=190197 RepID=UPI0031E46F38
MVLRWIARVVGICIAGVLLLGAIPAFAHVHVHPDKEVKPGTTDVQLTFHVPNERASAHTVAVRVRLAAGLAGVHAENSPGWTATPEPGAQGTLSAVTWKGGSIGGGDGVDFAVHVDRLPTGVAQLTFAVDQTYDDGEVVSWSEATTEGSPEPEHPAPVLVLDGAESAAAPGTAGVTGASGASGGAARTAAVVTAAVALPALLVLLADGRIRASNRRQKIAVGRE